MVSDRFRLQTLRGPAQIILRVLPFALFMLVLVLRGLIADGDSAGGVPGNGHSSPYGIDSRWLYLVQALLPLAALLVLRSGYTELRIRPQLLPTLFSLAVGIGIFFLWVAPAPGWTQVGTPAAPFVPLGPDGSLLWTLIGIRAFGAVLVVPLMEELFWRSFLMRWLDRRDFISLPPGAASWFGVLASAAVFALAHNLWLAGFAAGLAYALLYRRLGNLWYAVVAHASTNLALAIWVVDRHTWTYW